MGAVVNGVGIYVPEKILTNRDLEKMVDTSDNWITERTGIKERRVLPADSPMKASDMGVEASRQALQKAGLQPGNLDGIIAAGLNPDQTWPAMGCLIQSKLGAGGFAFDVTAACAGFVYAVNIASQMIDSGQCRHVLIVGSELISPIVDWEDRNTCVLFGDAAGAVVLSHSGDANRGVFYSNVKSDGRAHGILYLNNDPAKGKLQKIVMDGKQVFKIAVNSLSRILTESFEANGLSVNDVKMGFFHQANTRILDAVAEKVSLPSEKIWVNLQRYGNTSSASIPLALHEAVEAGRLQPGDLVFFAAIGGGMTWGLNLLRW